jgi:hypothetical protein
MVVRFAEWLKKPFHTLFAPTALAVLLPFAFSACKATIDDPNSNAASVSSASFSGIKAIDQIRSTSVQVAWESHPQAQFYLIYDASSADGKALATIAAPASSGTVSGLTPNTTYKLLVRILDTSGLMDANTATQSVTTWTEEYDAKKYPALDLSPSTVSLIAGETTTFFAYGGTAPYTYVLASGSGALDHTTGIFTAPSVSGTSIIRVIDANQKYADAAAVTQGVLALSPSTQSILVSSGTELTALGGMQPITFSITSGGSYGTLGDCTIPSSTCTRFTAASSVGSVLTGSTTIQATDSMGNTGQATVTITRAVSIYPTAITLETSQAQTFVASYGTPPYTFSVTGLGSITSAGIYTAPGSIGGPHTVKVTDALGNSATAAVTVATTGAFTGLSSITNLTGTTMKLNWASSSSATSYLVYRVITGTPSYVATVPALASNYTLTGLIPSTSYTYRVRLMDAQGNMDSNTNDVTASTSTVSLTHNGWNDIKSTGAVTPVSQATGLSSASASVYLNWNAMTPSEGTLQTYNIYRATSSGGQNFASPLATGITAAAHSYTDNTVSSSTIYYYVVRAVINGVESAPAAGGHPVEVKIIVPPDNMALVHRWMANQEMCGLLQSATDPTNHYRCVYTGLGGTGTHFDLEHSLLVDRYEMGCNYTPTLDCGAGSCLAMTVPTGISATSGTVYYNRATSHCYINTSAGSGTTWTFANAATLNSAQRAIIASNKPGLPPLSQIAQDRSWETCQAFTDPTFGTKRLLTHREQIIAAAWDSSIIHSLIGPLEVGTGPNSCNSVNATGLTYEDANIPTNLETIPSTNTNACRSVRTGSLFSSNCESRYKIRDLVGNVHEWSSDQLASCTNTTHSCTGQTSSLDASNTDWNGFSFDGTQGPGGGAVNVTTWFYTAMSFSSTRFLVPLGLPMVTGASASYGSLAIGTNAGQFNPIHFHGNSINLATDTSPGSTRGAFSLGAFVSGGSAGRFYIAINGTPATIGTTLGLRCGMNGD